MREITGQACLAPGTWQSLLDASAYREFLTGELLQHEKKPVPGLFLIEAGYAAVKIMPPHDNHLVMIDVLGPGDLVNADDSWSEEGAVLHIEALRTVRCYLLKRKFLYALLRAQPQLSEELLVWQSRTLKAWYQWLALFVYSDSETRLTQVLYRLAQRYGFPEGQGRRLYLPLRRRDFAELAGVTPETATRVMSQLRRRGLIRMEADSIFIPAPALLAPKPARQPP